MKLNILQLHQDNLRLRDSLYMARRTILKLLPEPLQAVLGTYEDCKTLSDAYRWEEEVIDRLLVLAKPRPAREMGDPWRDDQRACCPVCGEGVSDNFVPRLKGFVFPEGLRRHLAGTHSASRCPVFAQVAEFVMEWVRGSEGKEPPQPAVPGSQEQSQPGDPQSPLLLSARLRRRRKKGEYPVPPLLPGDAT